MVGLVGPLTTSIHLHDTNKYVGMHEKGTVEALSASGYICDFNTLLYRILIIYHEGLSVRT